MMAGKQIGEESSQGRHMQPDPQTSFLAARQCADRLHSVVKLVDAGGYARDKCGAAAQKRLVKVRSTSWLS